MRGRNRIVLNTSLEGFRFACDINKKYLIDITQHLGKDIILL